MSKSLKTYFAATIRFSCQNFDNQKHRANLNENKQHTDLLLISVETSCPPKELLAIKQTLALKVGYRILFGFRGTYHAMVILLNRCDRTS